MAIILIVALMFPLQSNKVYAANNIEILLNAAKLNPAPTGFAPTDFLVSCVLAEITTPDMTTYQKVKACYDYLINTCERGQWDFKYESVDYYEDVYGVRYDNACHLSWEAYAMLDGHVGVCDFYSAAFVVMMRAIGLDSYWVTGQTHAAGGGYTYHVWTILLLDGVEYVFDPQVEDNIAKGGPIKYYRFGKTYAELPDKYICDGEIAVPHGTEVHFEDLCKITQINYYLNRFSDPEYVAYFEEQLYYRVVRESYLYSGLVNIEVYRALYKDGTDWDLSKYTTEYPPFD